MTASDGPHCTRAANRWQMPMLFLAREVSHRLGVAVSYVYTEAGALDRPLGMSTIAVRQIGLGFVGMSDVALKPHLAAFQQSRFCSPIETVAPNTTRKAINV